MSSHHIIPSSRGGEEVVELPDNFHEAWHHLFQNLTPEEIPVFIGRVSNLMLTRINGEIEYREINRILEEVRDDE